MDATTFAWIGIGAALLGPVAAVFIAHKFQNTQIILSALTDIKVDLGQLKAQVSALSSLTANDSAAIKDDVRILKETQALLLIQKNSKTT